MFNAEGITGVEFCSIDEFVSNAEMEMLGFNHHEVEGRKWNGDRNVTGYFYKDDCPFVYAECYIAKLGMFTKLIIDKDIYEKLGMKKKAVVLNTGKGDGTRAVPSISMNSTIKAIHRCDYTDKEVDHVSMSLNIITKDSLRECNPICNNNNKKKKNIQAWGMRGDGSFCIHIVVQRKNLNMAVIEQLREEDYKLSFAKTTVTITKDFDSEVEAIRALRAYEEKYYGEYAYNPLLDMRGHFDSKFEQLILGTKTEEDIICEILEGYANDAVMIERYNLAKEYESRGLQYNKGTVLPNGKFVS